MEYKINNTEVDIFADDTFAGYGHRKITATITYAGYDKKFSSVVTNYEINKDSEADQSLEKFQLIENKIAEEVTEWLNEVIIKDFLEGAYIIVTSRNEEFITDRLQSNFVFITKLCDNWRLDWDLKNKKITQSYEYVPDESGTKEKLLCRICLNSECTDPCDESDFYVNSDGLILRRRVAIL